MSLFDRRLPEQEGPDGAAEGTRLVSDPRQKLKILFFISLASFLFGILVFWPVFEEGHRRIDPSMALLVWVSDGVALGWFAWFFAKHYILGEPFCYASDESPRLTQGWWLALVTLTAAVGFDLWVTYKLRDDEQAGMARAVIVEGEIFSIKKKTAAEYHLYSIHCRFKDGQGAWQEGSFQMNEHRRTRQFKDALPVQVQQALRNGQVACPINIAYDPLHPARNWIAGIDPGDGHQFHSLLCGIRLFQVLSIWVVASLLILASTSNRPLPWWYDLHMAVPFIIEAAYLGLMGGVMIFTDLVFN